MTRFEGSVSEDGTYCAKFVRLAGRLCGTIQPDGHMAAALTVRGGAEMRCDGIRIGKMANAWDNPFAGEYRVSYRMKPAQMSNNAGKIPSKPYPHRGPKPIRFRGIKFNLPLDMRTPSYSDGGDCAQWNIETVWDMDFWRRQLCSLRDMGYNTLSLWNLNPFPSMVKVPEFEDVALDDVWRTTLPFDDSYSGRAIDLVRPEHYQHYEVVRRMTIDEKIDFWRDVMRLAHEYGIQVFLFMWNVYVFGEQGKYGITPSLDNPITKAYFRASVRELIHTYPDLDGIGIAAGEQMGSDHQANEFWLWETYGQGIQDALELNPGRKFRLIHRLHLAQFEMIEQVWKDLPCPMEYSDKYSGAHMYSSVEPPFVRSTVEALPPERKLWLEVRNDDLYLHRWGAPDYARQYLQNMPEDECLAGFLMGADGYIPAREYAETDPRLKGKLHIDKHWYSYLIWGRLAQNPDTSDAFFRNAFQRHYPRIPHEAIDDLMAAMSAAGEILPQVSQLYFNPLDSAWYPEACLSHPQMFGFLGIMRWIKSRTPMPDSGCMTITDYADAVFHGNVPAGVQTPEEAARTLHTCSDTVLDRVESAIARVADCPEGMQKAEFLSTAFDQREMAWLGQYYGSKIIAAVQLRLLMLTGDEQYRTNGIAALRAALNQWKRYAGSAGFRYTPQRLCRHGSLDLPGLTKSVERDIEIAQGLSRQAQI